jgi:DNA-binding CsgD family transcriptional regulator
LTRVGRLEEASRYMHQAKALAREGNYRGQLAIALACEAAQLYRSGDLAAASATLVESLEIGTDHEVARLQRAAYGTAVALLTGDTKLFERCYDEARLARHTQAGLIGFSYAEHMVASGRGAEARELLHRALPTVAGGDFAPFELPLAIARWGAQADVEEARAQLARLEDLPSRPLRSACLALFDAYMASRVGAPEAKSLGLAAAADFERLQLPLWVADGLRLGGETERARALYARIGAVARLRELERHAAVASPGESAREGGTLTAREREVAELVADGLSNGEIAAKLFVSVKAVEKHLGAIYRKLDFSSRSKLIVYMKGH